MMPLGLSRPAGTYSMRRGSKRFTDVWLPRMVMPLFIKFPMGTRLSVGPYTSTIDTTPPFFTECPGEGCGRARLQQQLAGSGRHGVAGGIGTHDIDVHGGPHSVGRFLGERHRIF